MFRKSALKSHETFRFSWTIKDKLDPALSSVIKAHFITFLLFSVLIATTVVSAHARSNILLDEERGVLTVAPVIEKSADAVVNISVQTRVPASDNPLFRDPFFRRFFGIPDELPDQQAMSAGSGVIVDASKGHIITNHHVVNNADRITVKLKDGRQLTAKLIGSDPATDIALLEIKADRLVQLSFGDSQELRVGDFVIAIGNPFGLGQTVTSGIVSALGRSGLSVEKFEDFIQTDAPINPGNSGGALINTKGELVGINTAIIGPAGGNVGIGFAVPANMAKAVIAQLLRHGEVRRGMIGIAMQDVSPDIAQALNLPVPHGAIITKVENDSPAEKAGLRAGDAIVELDGSPVKNGNAVRNRVGLREQGSKVDFTIIRDGKKQTITVRVGKPRTASLDGESTIDQLKGARFTVIPLDHPAKSNVEGVFTAEVAIGSPAWRLGLRPGDIMLAVNQKGISTVAEFEKAAKESGGVLALNILRGDAQLFIVVQ